MKTTQIDIRGMSCGHCVAAVTQALKSVPGVKDARVSLAENAGTVTHEDSTSATALIGAVQEEGYEAEIRW